MEAIKYHLSAIVSELAPAKQGLQVYQASSENSFQVARSGEKIATCQNENIVQALRYCIMLVGIRSQNMPTQLEFDFLKEFIRRNFPGHTVEELKLAFDMAVGGKLDLGSDGAKAYENFSCEYVGRILTAYRHWAAQEAWYIEKNKPLAPKVYTDEELLQINIDYISYLVREEKKKLKAKKPLKWNAVWHRLYGQKERC